MLVFCFTFFGLNISFKREGLAKKAEAGKNQARRLDGWKGGWGAIRIKGVCGSPRARQLPTSCDLLVFFAGAYLWGTKSILFWEAASYFFFSSSICFSCSMRFLVSSYNDICDFSSTKLSISYYRTTTFYLMSYYVQGHSVSKFSFWSKNYKFLKSWKNSQFGF